MNDSGDQDRLGHTEDVVFEREIGAAYLDYAMSTIVSRALPDVRDGLKPVQRRILYSMLELGARAGSQHRKSARIVGDTMGKFHPHGDGAIYDALVHLAQEFVMRVPLVDGQGNFGSIDDDPAAAMRYTEARLNGVSEAMLADIGQDTVDFVDNFDTTAEMPAVLPGKFPNLVVNGAAGIAVGLATKIPPHNLGEVADAICALMENPDLTVDELQQIMKGPDFPTGGIIDKKKIKAAYASGRGSITMQARIVHETADNGRDTLIISELPYMVKKARLIVKIAELAQAKVLDDIVDIRDESDRKGMRIVVVLKRNSFPRSVTNQLLKHTALQSTFGVNAVSLVDGQPEVLGMREMLKHFINHRVEVVERRARFELERARAREHVLEGFLIALDNIDQVVELIRNAPTTDDAREQLMESFELSQIQANAVLDMQLRRLVALETQKLRDELEEIQARIRELVELLGDRNKVLAVIKEETLELKARFGTPRRTQVVDVLSTDMSDEDLNPDEDVVITISKKGYAKRLPIHEFKSQGRGGKGIRGVAVDQEEDGINHLILTNTHAHLLLFTNRGRVFKLRGFDIPQMSRTARGYVLANLVRLEKGEEVTAPIAIRNFEEHFNLVFGTVRGYVKRTALARYATVRSNGLLAMRLEENDELRWVRTSNGDNRVMFLTRNGMGIHFHEDDVRISGRISGGVYGIRLSDDDEVVGVDLTTDDDYVVVITSGGYGKKMEVGEFRPQGRGGKGLKAINLLGRTGHVVAAQVVADPEAQMFLLSNSGQMIRQSLGELRVLGRYAQGMIVQRLNEGEEVAGLAVSEESITESEFADDASPVPAGDPEGAVEPSE